MFLSFVFEYAGVNFEIGEEVDVKVVLISFPDYAVNFCNQDFVSIESFRSIYFVRHGCYDGAAYPVLSFVEAQVRIAMGEYKGHGWTTFEDVFPAEATSVEEYLQQVHKMAMIPAVQEAQKDDLRNFSDYMMTVLEVTNKNANSFLIDIVPKESEDFRQFASKINSAAFDNELQSCDDFRSELPTNGLTCFGYDELSSKPLYWLDFQVVGILDRFLLHSTSTVAGDLFSFCCIGFHFLLWISVVLEM
ncbi:hypothetical protein SSX86_008503 [Deinandra increscens subsp. villosa]|uniref:Uncharacterized protein n=1 Tax=Deinandra increscens subsp. villosa TaxID=3103831 RepID=A0AAP0DBE3_9ASTR